MATVKITKGFKHRCPSCGEEDSLRLDLGDVNNMCCVSCDVDITADDIRAIVDQWARLLAWLDTAPDREDS